MTRMLQFTFPMLAAASMALAGGLYVEVGNPAANPEAREMKATLVARVTSCHEPAKSKVVASLISIEGDRVVRQSVEAKALTSPGFWAIKGANEGLFEVAVTNPQFGEYQTTTLVRVTRSGIEWAGIRRITGAPPSLADFRSMLAAESASRRP